MLSMPSALLLFNFCMASWVACFVGACTLLFPHFVFSFGSVPVLLFYFCVHFCYPFNLSLLANFVPFCVYTDLYEVGISLLSFIPSCMPVLGFFA